MIASSEFRVRLKQLQGRVDAALRSTLKALTKEAPAAVVEAMAYSLFAPGKRLRPILVVFACEAAGGTEAEAWPAACAVEMVHTYSLIHDDLPAMDDDDLRRGMPTCHKRFGEALAILAGDGLLTLAFEVLAASYPPATATVGCMELARGAGISGMVGGQTLDLTADGKIATAEPPRTADDLERIHRLKTGALFRACLRLGLAAAQGERPGGPDPRLAAAFDGYGRAFGLAFQIADDLLDVEGSQDEAGKRVSKDAGRGKLTYPGLLGVEESRVRLEKQVAEAIQSISSLDTAAEPLAQMIRAVAASRSPSAR